MCKNLLLAECKDSTAPVLSEKGGRPGPSMLQHVTYMLTRARNTICHAADFTAFVSAILGWLLEMLCQRVLPSSSGEGHGHMRMLGNR